MSSFAPPFVTCKIPQKGSGLIACRDVEAGDLIFRENPKFWSPSPLVCSNCCTKMVGVSEQHCFCERDACGSNFCSSACRNISDETGHKYICSAIAHNDQFREICSDDNLGRHFGIALQVYGAIAQVSDRTKCGAIAAAQDILGDVFQTDFCRSLHAFRSGNPAFDETVFEDVVSRAYYSAYLERPLSILKGIFLDSKETWGKPAAGEFDAPLEFLESAVFHETFFRNLMGAFSVNNLSMALNVEGKGKDSTSAPYVVSGTGLYMTYATMNHSCICNTRNILVGAEIAVYASRPIFAGEEITTSYLHITDAATLSTRRRAKRLSKYLFSCDCPLCMAGDDEVKLCEAKKARRIKQDERHHEGVDSGSACDSSCSGDY